MSIGKVLERIASLPANFRSSRGINLHQDSESVIIKSETMCNLELKYIRRQYEHGDKNTGANI